MAAALRGAVRPGDILVELGAPGGRAGVRDVATAEAVAGAVRAVPELRLAGVAGYEGAIAHGTTPESLAAVARYLRDLRALADRLDVPGAGVLSAGGSASFDQGLPEPHVVRHADGTRSPVTGGRVSELNDQHAFLRLGPDTTAEVGDWVDCGLSHPCTVCDKWRLLPVVDGDTVGDLVRTWF